MQYMLMIYIEEAGWARLTPAERSAATAAYLAYTNALKSAGVHLGGAQLTPSATATTVHVEGGKPQVVDGPFIDTKEQFGGYYFIEAPDLDAAIAWAARCPGAHHGTIEVRAVVPPPA